MTAFEQGYAAFLAGRNHEQNPFDAESQPFSRERWGKGWMKAHRARMERAV